jgi:protein-tyrosine phosphatase
VNSSNPRTIDTDVFRTLFESRIDLPGTTNLRDLGGYPTDSGATIRPGALLRAEALAHPAEGVARVALWRDELVPAYRALNVSLTIDLRADAESALAPSAWAEASGGRLLAIPINEGGEGDATDYVRRLREGSLRSFTAADLAEYYALTLRRRARQFGLAIEAIASPGGVPVLVHCAAGKDRTGLLVALILETLGVPREIVVADYALTGVYRPNRVAAYADILAANSIPPADVSALFETPAEAMVRVLDGVDEEFGSVTQFLSGPAGLDADVLARLAEALLTSAPSPGRAGA